MNISSLDTTLILNIALIVISVCLVAAILLQQRGTGGLGTIFGGGGGEGNVYFKKRGMEKILFIATIVMAGLFILLSLVGVII